MRIFIRLSFYGFFQLGPSPCPLLFAWHPEIYQVLRIRQCYSRPIADEALLHLMKKAGCYMIKLGVESVVPRILNNINKKIEFKEIMQSLKTIKKVGIKSCVLIMYGLPGETYKDSIRTREWVKRNSSIIDQVHASTCLIYPGTGIFRYAKRNKYLGHNFKYTNTYYHKSLIKDFKDVPTVPRLIQPSLNRTQLSNIYWETIKPPISWELIKRKIFDVGTDKGLIYCFYELYRSSVFRIVKIVKYKY